MPQLATHLNSCLLSKRTLGASSPTVGTAFHLFAFFPSFRCLSNKAWEGQGTPVCWANCLFTRSLNELSRLTLLQLRGSWRIAWQYALHIWKERCSLVLHVITLGSLPACCASLWWEGVLYIVLSIQFQPSSGYVTAVLLCSRLFRGFSWSVYDCLVCVCGVS